MARTPAIQGASNRLIKSMRQNQAITGNRLSPDQIRAIVSGELDVEAARSLQGAQLEEQKRQFDIMNRQREDAIAAEKRASAISGAAQLGSLGYQATVTAPKEAALMSAQTDLLKSQAEAIRSGSTVATGAGTAAAIASPDVAAAAAGELGGSLATGATDTFVSAATGETLSTAGGGTQIAGAGGGILGSALGGAGAFSMGSTAAELVGMEGKAGGAVAGAAAGAAYGSIIPGIGTVVGGVLGGIGGALDAGTVICEELHRQGYLNKYILAHDGAYRVLHVDGETYFGYRLYAEPLVALMRRSKFITRLVKPFALSWAYTMANSINPKIKVVWWQKFIGTVLLTVGVPLCRRKARSLLTKKSEVSYG